MNKTVRYLIYFLIFGALVVAGYFGYKALKGSVESAASSYHWVTIDENYAPQNAVEEFIKNDAAVRGAFPVEIKNYGHNAKILKKFKSRQFAMPSENVLNMFFKNLDDWMLVDIKYKNKKNQEVQRTVLYIFANKQWTVGDSGSLLK
jgi:hypothetical protein